MCARGARAHPPHPPPALAPSRPQQHIGHSATLCSCLQAAGTCFARTEERAVGELSRLTDLARPRPHGVRRSGSSKLLLLAPRSRAGAAPELLCAPQSRVAGGDAPGAARMVSCAAPGAFGVRSECMPAAWRAAGARGLRRASGTVDPAARMASDALSTFGCV